MLRRLHKNQTLTWLNLGRNQIGDKGVEALSKNKTLVSLDVSENDIVARGVNLLAQNKTLESLNLGRNDIDDESVSVFTQNKTLTSLGLSENSITEKGAYAIIQNTLNGASRLINIDFSGNEINNDSELEALVLRCYKNNFILDFTDTPIFESMDKIIESAHRNRISALTLIVASRRNQMTINGNIIKKLHRMPPELMQKVYEEFVCALP